MNKKQHRHLLSALGATVASAALVFSLSACGSSNSSSDSKSSSDTSSSSSPTATLTGVSASGTPGKKLKVTIDKPVTVKSASYKVLQEGNGAQIKSGQRLCMQNVTYNARTGEQLSSTWEKNTPECSLTLSSTGMIPAYFKLFTSQKVNATVAIASPSQSSATSTSSSSTQTTDAYISVMTIVSIKNDPTRASGDKVTDIDSSLPKVTLASNGEPSISKAELKKYKATKKLVSQTLIKGKGAKVKATDTVVVKYSGWLLNGTKFDSSWSRNSTFSAALENGVIKGWGQGLTGKTIGSQVLLVVPPSLGYGTSAQGSIPANSTLVFVVDILSKS